MKILLFLDANKQMVSEEIKLTLQLRIYTILLPVSECQGLRDKPKNPTGNQNRKIIFISFAGHIPTVRKSKEGPERYSG